MNDGTPRVVDGFGPIVFSTSGFDRKQLAPAEKAAMGEKDEDREQRARDGRWEEELFASNTTQDLERK
jgi:hypothetical protein